MIDRGHQANPGFLLMLMRVAYPVRYCEHQHGESEGKQNADVFMDMLTDSGVNAMSDHQLAAMMVSDDSYAGSATYTRLEAKLRELFGMHWILPAHQGRACENILSQTFVKPGMIVPMNYHFTTTKAHITLNGVVEEYVKEEGLQVTSDLPFKGDMDIARLERLAKTKGADTIAFVRVEAGTNLIGGQPVSVANLEEVRKVCEKYGLILVMDASLLADNLYFNKTREESCKTLSIREITRRIADLCDIIYFSARKLGCVRGGAMCMRSEDVYKRMRGLVPLYEGFLTYGGMSVREIEALTVGLEETMDEDMINQGPQFIAYMVNELVKRGIPVITPAGGLGCHLDAMRFLDHVPPSQYIAGALASAMYIAGGVRGMERGTLSEQRNPDGSEVFSAMELLRLAMPRRVYSSRRSITPSTASDWLYQNRRLVGGLVFVEEPEILRFFYGRLKPVSDWQEKLVAKFRADFGDSL